MTFDDCLSDTVRTFQSLRTIKPAIDAAADLILRTLRSGNKILVAGNGGSAAEASHFATELSGRYAKNRKALAGLALSPDGSLLSCIGNDFGFDEIFARQVAALGQKGDLFVGITSSGNSPNILAGLKEAKNRGLSTLSFLGRGGGKAKGMADVDLVIPGERGASAQESHLFLIHYFCELIDAEYA